MNKLQRLSELLSEDDLFEMANIRKDDTGLPVNIWVSPKPENSKKEIRIKVSKSYSNRVDPRDTFSIYLDGREAIVKGDTGELKEKDISTVKSFLISRIDTFRKFWDKQIDDDEIKRLLKLPLPTKPT
jgi:hypothetical protein